MANSEHLNRLEKDRLKDLNDRTVSITPHKFDKLPHSAALESLGFKFQSLLWNGKGHVIFIVFEDLDSKRTAIKRLDGAICDGVRISLNFDRKIVPVREEELEDSRETNTLAVHGVPKGWTREELLRDFPKAEIGNSLTKEGTIFLKYRQSNHAIQDFIRNDNVQIQGKHVTVMFSHQRGFLRPSIYRYREARREAVKSPSSDGDLRVKINNNHERKWTDLVWYVVDSTTVGEREFKSVKEIIELSDLDFDEMQSKVEICRSFDFEKRVKLDWMDSIVQSFINRENLPGAVVKEQPRSWARDIVEAAWKFFIRRSPKGSYSSSSDDAGSSRGRKASSRVFKRPRLVSPSSSSRTRSSSSDSRCSRGSRTDQNDNPESKSQDTKEPKGSTIKREEDMAKYLDQTLQGVGIPKSKAEKATSKIVTCLTEVVDKVQKSTVTSREIAHLLESVGYKSSHVTAHLAAELVINYMLKEAQRPEAESKETKSRKLPANLMEVPEGFPRMAVVMAYYLHTRMDNSEDESKDLARSMVETWISCGVEYSRLHHICLSDQRTASKQVLLHEILVQNSPTDLNMNMFQLSTMIDLTIRYFYRAVKVS